MILLFCRLGVKMGTMSRGRRERNVKAEARGEESVFNVLGVLSDKNLFPWITEVIKVEVNSEMDGREKSDLVVYIDTDFIVNLGFIDEFRIQVKSSWEEIDGIGSHGFELLDFPSKKWRELALILLIGQQATEAIVGSFLAQVMNHMGIWGVEEKVRGFMSMQTEEVQTVFNNYMAKDLIGRDWQKVLDYVRGVDIKERRTGEGGGQVKFF